MWNFFNKEKTIKEAEAQEQREREQEQRLVREHERLTARLNLQNDVHKTALELIDKLKSSTDLLEDLRVRQKDIVKVFEDRPTLPQDRLGLIKEIMRLRFSKDNKNTRLDPAKRLQWIEDIFKNFSSNYPNIGISRQDIETCFDELVQEGV